MVDVGTFSTDPVDFPDVAVSLVARLNERGGDCERGVLVLGARVVGSALAWTLVEAFLGARFISDPRHVQRLAKVAALENRRT